jgi:hypothetical protein
VQGRWWKKWRKNGMLENNEGFLREIEDKGFLNNFNAIIV